MFGAGDAQRGQNLIEDRFKEFQPTAEFILFSNPNLDVGDPAFVSIVETVVAELRTLEKVASVQSFYDTGLPFMVSEDRSVLMARLVFESEEEQTLMEEYIDPVVDAVAAADQRAAGGGFEIKIAGAVSTGKDFQEVANEDFGKIMMITVVGGLIIMVLAFGAVVAALIPIAMAVTAIFAAIGVATVLSRAQPLNFYYFEMIILMGLAVGIDYSLFIISRFREERAAGRSKMEAIEVCCNTTGRAVFYAGVTVFVSLAGLLLTGDSLFYGLGLGAMIVVILTIVGSMTLLPALISLLDHRLNWLRIPGLGRPSTGGGIWGAITDVVLARPAIFAIVTLAALIALSVPLFTLHIGSLPLTSSQIPDGFQAKRAFEIMEQSFTLSEVQPLYVVVDPGVNGHINDSKVQDSVARLVAEVGEREAFAPPFDARPNPSGNLLVVSVPIADAHNEEKQAEGIRILRNTVIPAAFAGTGVDALVSGGPAYTVDARDNVNAKAPIVFAFVLGLAFLLLLVMFRSIAIPIKAIFLNLLSVGAAYGVLVLVFQEGVGEGLLDFEATGIIEIWMPLFLFAVLFGLSMDYHMLLLSRVKEAYQRGSSNEESVSMSIKATAALITSAALVMVLVFGAFSTSRILFFKQIGVGLGVAILIDATVIRAILLPASMKLLGDWNWYLPSWLGWLPRLSAEPEREVEPAVGD